MVESIESRYLAREEAVYMEAFMGSPRPERLKLRKSITYRLQGYFWPQGQNKESTGSAMGPCQEKHAQVRLKGASKKEEALPSDHQWTCNTETYR